MKNLRPITEREENLIQLYAHCELGMTPHQFYAKWDVSQEVIALITARSSSTVGRWFCRGLTRRYPTVNDLRHLALMDFLLEYFEEIPEKLRNLLYHLDSK
jgi:hypothetical protein